MALTFSRIICKLDPYITMDEPTCTNNLTSNGGPTGSPTNGVKISGITMTNITGTATSTAKDYYILCGSGSCSDFVFHDINITGGSGDSCNFTPSGNFKC